MRRAFTLIELLVVIAIVTILAAILFPVFAQAKAAAKKSACASNLKQYTHAALMYLADYDDAFPQSAYSLERDRLRAGSGDRVFTVYDATLPYVKNVQIAACPSQHPPIDLEEIVRRLGLRTTGAIRHFGFAINFALFQDPAIGFGETAVVVQTELADPAHTTMYYDARLVAPPQHPEVPGCPRPRGFFFTWDNFSGDPRHADGMNVSFAEGSVRFVKNRGAIPGTSTRGCPNNRPTCPTYQPPCDMSGIPEGVANT